MIVVMSDYSAHKGGQILHLSDVLSLGEMHSFVGRAMSLDRSACNTYHEHQCYSISYCIRSTPVLTLYHYTINQLHKPHLCMCIKLILINGRR